MNQKRLNLRIQQSDKEYYPKFMKIIDREGKYYLKESSLDDIRDDCAKKEHILLEQWLKRNNLKIIKLKSGFYKIYL